MVSERTAVLIREAMVSEYFDLRVPRSWPQTITKMVDSFVQNFSCCFKVFKFAEESAGTGVPRSSETPPS